MQRKSLLAIILVVATLGIFSQTVIKKELTVESGKAAYQKKNGIGNSVSLKQAIEKNNLQVQPSQFGENPDVKKNYVVSVLLPFNGASSIETIDAFINARETGVKPQLIGEDAQTALEFYDGILYALKDINDSLLHIDINFFDTWNSDSVTRELLKNKTIQYSNIIIGPATNSNAKLVADFCKQRKIINIQPFSPSKTLTDNNPLHIKLAPTIDAHTDNMLRSLLDSFTKDNIIIYCTNQESSLQTATRFDSLLKDYNKTAKEKITTTLFNYSAPIINGVKKNFLDLMHPTKRNVVVVCVFDESGAQLVIKQLAEKKINAIVYGMPTWLGSEILRLDYLNRLNARFTEQFVLDTTTDKNLAFYYSFFHEYGTYPGKYAWLGYDLTNWLVKSLKAEGVFPYNLQGTFYSGLGYKFQFREVQTQRPNEKPRTEYFENTFLHLLRLDNYKLLKDW